MGSMPRATAVTPIALALVAALLAAGCGAAALSDRETATEAKAAGATDASTAEPTASAAPAASTEAAEPTDQASVEPTADNAGAWSAVDAGAQVFAGDLDHATQSIATCETDAAAGDDFNACAGRAYQAIADSATTLAGVIDGASAKADGDCGAGLASMRSATQTLIDDYTAAISTTDWTSADTLRARIADDAQAYADTALAAASSCMT